MGAEIAKARELEKMKATATDLGIDDEVKAMMSFGTEGAKTVTTQIHKDLPLSNLQLNEIVKDIRQLYREAE